MRRPHLTSSDIRSIYRSYPNSLDAEIFAVTADEQFSKDLVRQLGSRGVSIAQSSHALDRRRGIENGFVTRNEDSKIIVVFSNRSFNIFKFVNELNTRFRSQADRIIPILLDKECYDLLPNFIKDRNPFDFSNVGDFQKQADYLAEVLTAHRTGVPAYGSNKEYASDANKNAELSELYLDSYVSEKLELPPVEQVIPQPALLAVQFSSEDEGPIDLSPQAALGEFLEQSLHQAEDYIELRIKAGDLADLGINRLGRLSRPVSRFIELPVDISLVRLKIFWSRINSLRIILQDHYDASYRREKGEIDERILDPVVVSHL
ncbi:hypothetical protein U8607_24170, partial [Methylobacterium durans]|uniref:hypothetical protein n=1 Tax=Methylobacterium durans TaxID=2202825 RepID=UPI002AFF9F17